ncbi:MAG TPA: YbhB/YbcL family Raf kinase inhibitor-like protein [Acidimicrobiales bacterium]|jgi:hypothetical protein|nr:YbhB/YbcL family Raf kinase inhibitor-like protein [Acidimicrobiales bacterium]
MRRATVIVIAIALIGCAHDGRSLRPPPPGASAPPLATTTIPGQVGTVAAPLTLTSSAFGSGEPIPKQFTCDGAGTSPPLAWGAVPQGTVELAIVVTDADANGFVHWAIGGLDTSVQALAAGAVPDGAVEAKNDAGTTGWSGPCPPKGSAHHYVFTLYALTRPSGLAAGVSGKDAQSTITKTPGVVATLTGSYQRA